MASYSRGAGPVKRKILEVLKDGLWHDAKELRDCLMDDMAGEHTVPVHINQLKAVLHRHGYTIKGRKLHGWKQQYRWVARLADED